MGKKAPPAPDYTGAALAQSEASKELTAQQTFANRPTLNTPWGQQTWQASKQIDPSTGKPVTGWESNITLSGQQQEALDSQMAVQTGRSKGAEALLNGALSSFGVEKTGGGKFGGPENYSNPKGISYDGISEGAGRITAPTADDGAWRQKAQDAALAFQKPLQQERQAALENRLATMGLTRGSEAWDREMRSNNDQTTRDGLQVFDSARNEAKLMSDQAAQMQSMQVQAGGFNQQLRQQEIAEMLAKRSQPLNELNALLTGQQVQSPQMPTFNTAGRAETPQLLGAAQSQYSAALDSTNASNAAFGNLMSGAASLGSAAMGNPAGWAGLFKM